MKSMFLIQYLDICSAYFMTKKPEKLFSSFFSFTSGFVYYGVVLMTTQLMQQTPENGTSCDSGIANLP